MGTVKLIVFFFQKRTVAGSPETVTVPTAVPKFKPTMVSFWPTATFWAAMLVIVGVKLKLTPLLLPFTTTGPEPATPFGAFTKIWVPKAFQETIWAGAPLTVTVPGAEPNPVPVMVSCVEGRPDVGLIEVMTGLAPQSAATGMLTKMSTIPKRTPIRLKIVNS